MASRAGMVALLRVLFGRLWNPDRPVSSLALLGTLAGPLITRQQALYVTEARGYLLALSPVPGPFPIPPGVIGMGANGSTIAQLAGLAPAIYWQRTGLGMDPGQAALSAQSWLTRLGVSEPFRAANATVHHAARADERTTGLVIRITRPDACQFCLDLADEDYTAAGAGFEAHHSCQCTASPQFR
jgi:hypothetical protein